MASAEYTSLRIVTKWTKHAMAISIVLQFSQVEENIYSLIFLEF